jgi:hypothetical protein
MKLVRLSALRTGRLYPPPPPRKYSPTLVIIPFQKNPVNNIGFVLKSGSSSLGVSYLLELSDNDRIALSSVGRDSSVGIAPRYGLELQGIQFRCDFPHLTRPALGPHPASRTKGTVSLCRGYGSRGVARPPPPPSSADVKER